MLKAKLTDARKALFRVVEIFTVKGSYAFTALGKHFREDYWGRNINREIRHELALPEDEARRKISARLIRHFGPAGTEGLATACLDDLATLIVAFHRGDWERDIETRLLTATADFTPRQLPDKAWFALTYIANASGLGHLGYHFRELARRRILDLRVSAQSSDAEVLKFFKAAADGGDLDLARQALSLAQGRSSLAKTARKMALHLAILAGDRPASVSLYEADYSGMDRAFADYVRGKRIAVVGPAPCTEDVAAEIDQFDIVIRPNYRGRDNLPPAAEFGSKTHVSYYSYTNSKQILKSGQLDFLFDLDFPVFKSAEDIKKLRKIRPDAKVRHMIKPNNFYLAGKGTMIQNILYDLLHFDPQEIKIFHVNFYLSESPYYSSYISPANNVKHVSVLWLDYANHDLVTQINLSRILLDHGQITADQQATAVMAIDNAAYCQEIQRLYAPTPAGPA
jgi:glycerophosphoryl diester phosphodiesterase